MCTPVMLLGYTIYRILYKEPLELKEASSERDESSGRGVRSDHERYERHDFGGGNSDSAAEYP